MVEMPRPESFATATEGSAAASAAPVSRRQMLRRGVLAVVLMAGTALAGVYGYDYWTSGRFLQSTDDAYVKADSTIIAPRIAGYIADVLVQDNAEVAAGQVLARIDDRDYRTALAQARADVAATGATIRNLDAQIVLQQSLVDQAHASIEATQASLDFAVSDAARYRDLMQTGSGTIQRAQQTEAVRAQTAAQLQRDNAGLVAAQKKVAVLTTEREQAQAQLAKSEAAARQAELNLSYTTITAPVAGQVGARTLRVGQFVTAGTQLMAVVPLHAAYVVANFKETQLTYVRDGQPVELRIDSFPDLRLKGHVDSLSPASGLEFALLPPDNATGNFTKIVQRIPVKIVLDDPADAGLLRAGMSVEPTVDTKATVLAARNAPTGTATAGRRVLRPTRNAANDAGGMM